MKYLSLTIPGYGKIQTPNNVPSGADAPSNILQVALDLLFLFGIALALIFTIYGGVLWASSGGDKAKLDTARRTITYSIVGLIIMILAWAIVGAIGSALGAPPGLWNFMPKQQSPVIPPGIGS